MQRGSSVNFQPVQSAMHAVSHADRTVPPTYLLPPDRSLGTIVVLDDHGSVAKTLEEKMALASRQAKAVKDYSPLWEGVLNLRRPEPDEDANDYRAECSHVVKDWCKAYEAMTGHAVLRADVHLDEGHIVDGVTMLNAHAHLICDKTNVQGRVIKMTPQKLRELQTVTAEITNLERGVNSRVSGKKHITAHQYKYLAERNQLENQKAVETLKSEVVNLKAQIEADYKAARAAMVASKIATQADYQKLKKEREEALAEAAKVPALEAQVTQQAAAFESLKVKAMAVITPLRKEVKTMKTQITQLEADKAQLATEAAKWAAKAKEYQEAKAAGTPAHLIVPGEAPSTPNRGAKPGLHGQMAIEQPKTPAEQPKTQNPDIPTPKPKKSLSEAFKATLKEFFQGWVEFIKHKGFTHEELDVSKGQYRGTILDKDDLFAVQKTGRHTCVIHLLDDLDMNPDQDNPEILIHYQDGHGRVSGQQPEQYKYPSPGDR